MRETIHKSIEQLEARLDEIRLSPRDLAALELIVIRPKIGERTLLDEGTLDLDRGLIGDNWKTRGGSRTKDGFGHPEMQLTIMNSRVAALVAGSKQRWALAGDQLYIDFDLSSVNLPPGTGISIGSAIIETTTPPHTGCKAFAARFGLEA